MPSIAALQIRSIAPDDRGERAFARARRSAADRRIEVADAALARSLRDTPLNGRIDQVQIIS